MKKAKRKYNMDRDFLKEMLEQEFYNEHPIPNYNHATGKLERLCVPVKREETKEYNIDLNTYLLCQ